MVKREVKVGLDLTKETKKNENFIVQVIPILTWDKIKEAAKNVGLDLTKKQCK